MRKAIFGVVVVGLLIWAVQFMRSSQTENADAVMPAPALSQESPAAVIDTAVSSTAAGITAITQDAQTAGTEAAGAVMDAAQAASTEAATAASSIAPAASEAPAAGSAQ